MSAMLTADWFPLGRDVYFRKFELYPISFQHEISTNNLLVAAPYGGSIAVTRNPKKLVKVQGASKPLILLYTSSGKLTAKLQWSSGQLISFGWSQQEELLCVQDDGMVLIYDMFGTYQHTFSMGNAAKDTKVIDAKFFTTLNSTGIAVLTSTNRIFLVNNVSEPKVRPVTDVPRYGSIDCWCMVHCDRETQVILSNREGVFVIHQSHQNTFPLNTLFNNKINNVVAIAVSGNNRHIALYADTGHLYIGSIDFREKYCECYTNIKEPLANIAWCGTEAVVCSWSSTIMVIGRTAETIVYNYDGPVHLVSEVDGVRVLSSSSHEMIQKVPNVVQRIFRINSTDPASYLLEASKQFQKKSHKADSYIDLVKDKLDSAIRACIDGASHEFDFETQKILMRAAKFGKGFSKTMDAEYYVQMCRTLRVLNAVRHPALIDYEPRAHQQVPLLLTLGEERAALHKAVESGNTDLVYTVILHLRENMTLGDFQISIMHCPLAMALYIKYCQSHNRETLRDIYNQYDDFHSQAVWFITESYQRKNMMSRDALLQSAQENFKLARSDTNASLTEEQIKLLKYQRSLEDTLNELHDTVKILLLRNELKLADKLRSEYKIPDRRYWWLRIQCLADQGLWSDLEKFSKSKKSPIGYEPFIDECLKYNEKLEARKYLARVKDNLKVKYLVKLNMLNDAAQTAFDQKDSSALTFVLAQCGSSDRQLVDKINMFLTALKN
ncbi:Vacuolar protein sorting-associated protein 16-like protein [Ooceraea biroi]|uniref:Vacuolar protein sorting-associated protein 16 homolog n=1 Tax=Ooceraea biroi TaxID=2015173 RepID=A0A026VX03_OOCBI|nr:Vacuolar protein sorting-associated protein 16-like protein [Ooceraea biroi]